MGYEDISTSVGQDAAFVNALMTVETAVTAWAKSDTVNGENSRVTQELEVAWDAAQTQLIATADGIIASRIARALRARGFNA